MPLQAISAPSSGTTSDKLLVMLHGWGANAQDVAGLAPYLNLSGYQMCFPDAPFPHPMSPGGRMWYNFPTNYDFQRPYDFEAQADLHTSRQQLIAWLQSLASTTGIPLEKTVLGGFSQGGAMTLDVGPRLPLAGMLVLSGYCHGPLIKPKTLCPLLLIHGRQDLVVPPSKAHEAKSALTEQGWTVNFQMFDMGHEISIDAMHQVGQFCKALG
ncbi:MAG: dienelactone hydrolase family protein [Cyanobacteria bacterium P01_A01_bin.114]